MRYDPIVRVLILEEGLHAKQGIIESKAHTIRDLRERIAGLNSWINLDNTICMCGCSHADHEGYGDEGECCGIEGHQCIRTAPAVRVKIAELEDDLQITRREKEVFRDCLINLGLDIAALEAAFCRGPETGEKVEP